MDGSVVGVPRPVGASRLQPHALADVAPTDAPAEVSAVVVPHGVGAAHRGLSSPFRGAVPITVSIPIVVAVPVALVTRVAMPWRIARSGRLRPSVAWLAIGVVVSLIPATLAVRLGKGRTRHGQQAGADGAQQ